MLGRLTDSWVSPSPVLLRSPAYKLAAAILVPSMERLPSHGVAVGRQDMAMSLEGHDVSF
jgi:hypothetical protein